jgi:hypothetical protein
MLSRLLERHFPVEMHKKVKNLKSVPWKPRAQPNLKTFTFKDVSKPAAKSIRNIKSPQSNSGKSEFDLL